MLRTVMLGKSLCPTFGKIVTTFKGFKIREDDEEQAGQSHLDTSMTFMAQKSQRGGVVAIFLKKWTAQRKMN